jgi:hypothetical protein
VAFDANREETKKGREVSQKSTYKMNWGGIFPFLGDKFTRYPRKWPRIELWKMWGK